MATTLQQLMRLPLRLEGDFAEGLKAHLDEFLQVSRTHLSPSEHVRADGLSSAVSEAIDQYLKGFSGQAHAVLEQGLQVVGADLKSLGASPEGPFFRMRVEHHDELRACDMFHVPFQLRHRIAPHRFSIPGLPCLYTACSTFVCWEELSRPPLHSVQVAAIRKNADANLRVLSLVVPPSPTPAVLICYPLMAACSVRAKRKDVFRPQYIVPQLLLQWLTQSNDFDGIECVSSHVSSENDRHLSTNIVFPVRNVAKQGYCSRLAQLLQVTEPMAWEFTTASGLDGETKRPSGNLVHNGCPFDYKASLFSYVEAVLSTRPAVQI